MVRETLTRGIPLQNHGCNRKQGLINGFFNKTHDMMRNHGGKRKPRVGYVKPSILSGLQRVINAMHLETPRVLNDDDGCVELSFGMFT